MISRLFYFLIAATIFAGCDQNKTGGNNCSTLQDGIDTSIYNINLNKNGNVILSRKTVYNKNYFAKAPTTERIEPLDADSMISMHILPDVDSVSHILKDGLSKSVGFSIDSLLKYYNELSSELGQAPDSMRIYFGVYNKYNTPRGRRNYENRMTCILVPMVNGNDVRYDNNKFTYPINIGTLCPPNCDTSKFEDHQKGSIYLKKAAVIAKATAW